MSSHTDDSGWVPVTTVQHKHWKIISLLADWDLGSWLHRCFTYKTGNSITTGLCRYDIHVLWIVVFNFFKVPLLLYL